MSAPWPHRLRARHPIEYNFYYKHARMCREVNVEMRIEVARLRPAVLDNAVASELLNRLQAQGERDIYDRALQAMLDAAAKAGYIQEGSTVINAPENVALFVTAYA